MPIKLYPLKSSMLQCCGVHGNDLLVMFTVGKCYRVHGAAGKLYELTNAESADQFYNRELKNKFEVSRAVEYE